MNAFTPRRDFSDQPRRDELTEALRSAHHVIKMATAPSQPRPSRQVQQRIFDLLDAIQFITDHRGGTPINNLGEALGRIGSAIAALERAAERDRRTIAGRFVQWVRSRRFPEGQMTLAAPSASGKGVGSIIPSLLGWNGPAKVHDPKTDPNTLH